MYKRPSRSKKLAAMTLSAVSSEWAFTGAGSPFPLYFLLAYFDSVVESCTQVLSVVILCSKNESFPPLEFSQESSTPANYSIFAHD